ncbi:EamA family transporter [Mucilaginibacter antarcticus]|uniref:EamA family transporter n=1 Tax=Mucilaginibacter antarcticus TaxID=1855725 RepID=A0ABW5XLE7_9SPHI
MSKAAPKTDWKIILAFAAVYIIWGTTYLAIRIGIESMPPFIMAGLRYVIAGVLMLLYIKIKGEVVIDKNVTSNFLLGAFMLTCGQGTIFWAEKYVPSGLTAVLISTAPIWYIIADKRHWRTYFTSKLTMFSIVLGLVGVWVLFKDQAVIGTSSKMIYIASAVIIISCFCWVTASLWYKYNHTPGSLFKNIGWQLMGGAVACLLVGIPTGEWAQFHIADVSVRSWCALFYLAIAGSIVAFTAMFWLLERRPAPIVGTYAYVNPVIAVLLGYLVANEIITTSQVFGMVVILLAAYLANKVKFSTAA